MAGPDLEDLNPEQRAAVEQTSGPLLVLAGAGSGKTRVLTHRIAHLIDHAGVAPWNILAVTFTNKAAGEMRERIEHLVGDEAAGRLWIGTFHSVCARLLRYEAQAFGLHTDFTIYDTDDCRALVRRLLDALDLSEQDFPVRQVHGEISRAKNAMIDVATFAGSAAHNPHKRRIADIYEVYEKGLRANNAFDFDDLIVEPVRLLQQHPDVLEKWRARFRHILVDEYQDTNRPQYLLTKLLAAEHHNLCVVGDDDQSIYQFRGADIRNIIDFEKDYPETLVIRLEQNYRSTGRILAAANAVIDNNVDRKGKNLWTAIGDGDRIQVAECGDDRGEARHVVAQIRQLCRQHDYTLSDAAILYRTNAQSRVFEEELRRHRMSYVIVGGIRFYERKEIKDVLAYLRLLVNPADDISLLRVINAPKRGIGDTTVDKIALFARHTHTDLLQAALHAGDVPGLGGRAVKAVTGFGELMSGLAQEIAQARLSLPELAQEVLERSGYLEALRAIDTPETDSRIDNLGELVNSMSEFCGRYEGDGIGLSQFLEDVALMTSEDEALAGATTGTLTMMTLHAAKGLEYPVVAMCGMEEEIFPTQRAMEESRAQPRAIEEERRLCYVGITRSRRHLMLSYARWRYLFGQGREMLPSRFLDEIPQDLVETTQVKAELAWGAPAGAGRRGRRQDRTMPSPPKRMQPSSYEKPAPQRSAPSGVHYVPDEDSGLQMQFPGAGDDNTIDVAGGEDLLAVGRWVEHPAWGRGQIVDREGSGSDTKLSIRFGGTTKRVIAAYAQLQPA
ncbi:MAG: UvrD-helicase domain-containing protein [Candidatus Latescibacterota bacterium]|nr:UvrD-helicase domain-containing protein [Candidatus Latescibacterota bacterium]